MHLQKFKTHVIHDNCNPVWNDELTLSVKDLSLPIKLVSDVSDITWILFSLTMHVFLSFSDVIACFVEVESE